MADFYDNFIDYVVMPSENDHYGSGYGGVGAGKIPTELLLTPLMQGLGNMPGYISSGFALPTSGTLAGSQVNCVVTAGTATIKGHRIEGTSNININVPINDKSFVWLCLELDGSNKAYRPIIHTDTTWQYPTDPCLPLGWLDVGATDISTTYECGFSGQIVYGSINTDGSNNPDMEDSDTYMGTANWTPSKVDASTFRITYNTSFHSQPWVFFATSTPPADPSTGFSISRGTNKAYHDFTTSPAVTILFYIIG